MAEKVDDSRTGTIALTAPVVLAEGELVEVDIPTSVERGARYDVTAKVHNKGGSDGTFAVRWYINTVLQIESKITVAPGATSTDKVPSLVAPTTGDSMTYNLRLIRFI